MIAGGRGIDEEFSPLTHAGGIVTLSVDGHAAAVLVISRPGDDEVAGRVHRHRWIFLVAGGRGVHQELAADVIAVGVEALGVDPLARPVLIGALPGYHVAAVSGHRYVILVAEGEDLVAGGERIDQRLGVVLERRFRRHSKAGLPLSSCVFGEATVGVGLLPKDSERA